MTEYLAELSCRYGWMNAEILPSAPMSVCHTKSIFKTFQNRAMRSCGQERAMSDNYGIVIVGFSIRTANRAVCPWTRQTENPAAAGYGAACGHDATAGEIREV